ncbi:tetratricopeptide repeat protein [Poseidonibacter antarcticus]|uniref:tetratricopeptide repeat protein n=1 Tax=Poseidonibacter antarcticus TaxID=2478538 RepID=UPI000EF4F70D|nr:tetratricopeptide repeat protein [Poseidonibacter antarcticus]
MDNIVLEYRDPLFSIIILVALVFVISFFAYSYGIYRERIARKDYRKLSRRFELGKLKEEDYVHLYKTYNLPFDSILLLASSFLHKGDYNKAINVYLTLLEHVNDRVKKEELLELLGITYFKCGFLQRSKDVFMRILKFSPRNKKALTYLLIIHEKLKDFKKAKEITSCLKELDKNVSKDETYLDALIILNDPLSSYDKRIELLHKIYKKDKSIQRLFVQFLLQFNSTYFWNHLEEFNPKSFIDLMWYLNYDDINFKKVSTNDFLLELYNAKGYLNNLEHSEDFIFDILILLHKHSKKVKATLDFEFVCSSCKQTHPIYENRCPHCHNILTFSVNHTLSKSLDQAVQSLQ